MTTWPAYILVLWGSDFNELDAITFVTVLRRAGLRTKIVAVDGAGRAGSLGIAILPDLSLRQSLDLMEATRCIVVPCHPRYWKRLAEDPNYGALMQAAAACNVVTIVNSHGPDVEAVFVPFGPRLTQLRTYQSEGVTAYAVALAAEYSDPH